ncbi:hypothetical protein AALA48_08855 [Bifidobacterium pseudolongum]|uniref:serine O-acetyltransferase n=1 Tax=Bifidobacterium pseudolongum TaxID=1694 RepID=UPI0035126265
MVIRTKADLREYIEADASVQPASNNILHRLFGGKITKMKVHLRKAEYYYNNPSLTHKILYAFHYMRLRRMTASFCSEIPINVFGKGLVIWHPERIIVNPQAKVGEYCSISSGIVIAQAHDKNPVIGDHVELMIDAKVLGGIVVADYVRIGASALVLKDIDEPNTTWAGVPARKISDRGGLDNPVGM